MVLFLIFPGSQVLRMAGFPVFPGSQVLRMVGFPVFPGSQVLRMVGFQYFQIHKSQKSSFETQHGLFGTDSKAKMISKYILDNSAAIPTNFPYIKHCF